jgi:DNA-binding NtrC family response regulator
VLIVDDDSEVRHSLMRSLQEAGFTVSGAWSAETALEKLDCGLIVDVIVSDFAMDGMNGVDFIRAARARRPGLPAILLTGQVGEVPQAQGGPFVLLQKPVRLSELVDQLAASG